MNYSTAPRQRAIVTKVGSAAQFWRPLFWLAFAVALALLLAPASAVSATRLWVATWLPFAAQLDALDVTRNIDKWVHLGLFIVLGGLGRQAWILAAERRRLLRGLLFMAFATEGLQHFIPGRSASAADLLTDVAGLALVSLLARAATRTAPAHET